MIVADAGVRWTIVHLDKADPIVRRYPVPGGWLYQVSNQIAGDAPDRDTRMQFFSWHPPVFVPTTDHDDPQR